MRDQLKARQDQLPPHLVRLSGDWALWRTVCLRGAGFPVSLLADLGAPGLAGAADSLNSESGSSESGSSGTVDLGTVDLGTVRLGTARAAYAAEFTAEVRRQSSALHRMAGLPPLREAVAWQNRRALETGINVLLRHEPGAGKRNSQHRQHEALVASYLQRYCAKNDTIGFFGPVSWSQLDDQAGLRITPAAAGRNL